MSVATDHSKVPGAMEHTKRRELPDGSLIEFEEAPAGWLTKAGEVRRKDWRAYFYQPAGGERVRVTSVTTILDAILPKPGLSPWAEARGSEGAVEAVRAGEIDPDGCADPVGIVRRLRLGADRARDDAADRGLNTHGILERYMVTGAAPNPAEHPEAHHGYIRGATRWLLHADPEPTAVEELVASPDDGYAGRMDLRAIIGGLLTSVDFKTQEKGYIYPGGHLQLGLYERGAIACGDEPADRLLVVVVAADGSFREMAADHHDDVIDSALDFYQRVKPINSACESANRIEREARKAAA